MDSYTLYTREGMDDLFLLIRDKVEVGPVVVTIKKKVNRRTITQNAAMHKYFAIMAEKLQDSGHDQKSIIGSFREGFSLPATPAMIKEIFREVGKAMFKKDSTADLTTVEIQKVYEAVDQRFGEVTGCRSDWPSNEAPILGEKTK